MRRILAIMTMVIGLSACTTTPNYNHLDAEARPLIKSVDSVLIAKQDEIGTNIKVSKLSSYVQGHIIPVLLDIGVNGYRSHKAGKLVKPMRETLKEYDYTVDLKEEFLQALATSSLDGVDNLKILREEPQGFRHIYHRKSKADAVMFIDTNYAFSSNFDALNVATGVMIFPVNPALSPYKERPDTDNVLELTDNIYRNQFMARVPLDLSAVGKTSENAALWSEMSEEDLTFILQTAASKLAGHFSADLSIDELPDGSSTDDISNDDVTVIVSEETTQAPEETSSPEPANSNTGA